MIHNKRKKKLYNLIVMLLESTQQQKNAYDVKTERETKIKKGVRKTM